MLGLARTFRLVLPGRPLGRRGVITRRLALVATASGLEPLRGRRVGAPDGQAILADHVGTEGLLEGGGLRLRDLEEALLVPDADRADVVAGEVAGLAQHRQQPARVLMRLTPALDREPDGGTELGARRRRECRRDGGEVLGRGLTLGLEPQIGGGELLGGEARSQLDHGGGLALGDLLEPGGVCQHPLPVLLAHLVGTGGQSPCRREFRPAQKPLRLLLRGRRHDQRADALAPGAARAARSVQQRVRPGGQFGMDDEVEVGQVDAAGRHVGGDADAGAAVAHRLKRMGAFSLATARRRGRRRRSRGWTGASSGGSPSPACCRRPAHWPPRGSAER